MNRSIWITIAFGVVAAIGLYSLPKVAVNSKNKVQTSEHQGKSDTVTTQPSAQSTETTTVEEAHTNALTPQQQREADGLRTKYVSSVEPKQRAKAAIEFSDFFSKNRKFDSAAKYAEVVAILDPSERNMLVAGDRYYDAFGFAAVDEKAKKLGEKTREWYQKVLDRNPNILIAKANMAMTYVSSDNPMQGIMMLREIIAADPTNEVALFNLGLLSMRSNQYQKAVDRFGQVLKNNANNVKARFYLGVSLAQLGKNSEALAELAKVKKTEADPTILQAIGELEKELK